MELRASRSGCHANIPTGSLLACIFSIMRANSSRPGIFALLLSINVSVTTNFSLFASSVSSCICASMDIACLSSASEDLRAYRKNLVDMFSTFWLWKFFEYANIINRYKYFVIVHKLLCCDLRRAALAFYGKEMSVNKTRGNFLRSYCTDYILA